MRAVLVLALSLAPHVIAAPVAAQRPAVAVGSVIRGTLNGRLTEGTLLQIPVTGEPLQIKVGSGNALLRWDDPSLALRTRQGHRNRGALTGTLIAMGIGATAGLLSGENWLFTTEEKAIGMALFAAPVGAIIGAVASPGAQWAPLGSRPTPSRLSPWITPNQLGLRVRF